MSLTQEAIDELKQIYKVEFNEELSNQEAWDMGHDLVNLFKALCKYNHDNQNKSLKVKDAK